MGRRAFLAVAGLLLSALRAAAERPPMPIGPPVVVPPKPVGPPVAPKLPKPGVPYDADHRCDNCGHESAQGSGTWIQRGDMPDGGHKHTCPKCGQSWQHGGHRHEAIQLAHPLAVPGCANGNCPTERRRFFRW